MKKLILILLVAMLVLVGCDDSPCSKSSRSKGRKVRKMQTQLGQSKIVSATRFDQLGELFTVCQDGYKFVVLFRYNDSGTVKQIYQEGQSPNHPPQPVRCY